MTTATPAPITTLHALERQFRSQIPSVNLLGELPLTPELHEELGAAIAGLIKRNDLPTASRMMRTRYPHCLAVFLVLQGIFHYDQGRYWPSLHERIRAKGPRAAALEAEWGQFFLEFLAEQDLATLTGLERSLRYVTPILLHGGIPQYCLNDYFQLIFVRFDDLLHEARLPLDEATLDTLASVAERSAADRPVARLIRYGGDFARDLLARTLELAQLTAERQQLPDPTEVGLPQRVLDQYARWLASRRQRAQERDPAWRPRRPELWFDRGATGCIWSCQPSSCPTVNGPMRTGRLADSRACVSIRLGRALSRHAGRRAPSRWPCRRWRLAIRYASVMGARPLSSGRFLASMRNSRSWLSSRGAGRSCARRQACPPVNSGCSVPPMCHCGSRAGGR
ncbi:MAG: hypothetical protein AB4911_19740 [Oscillochloridaceae bacterium umkhey_bin13]